MNTIEQNKTDRLEKLFSIYVAHPDAENILKKIERCHLSRTYSQNPRSMSLIGETGSGKTTLIEQYMARHPPSETEKTTSVPIFKSIIQPDTSILDFVISLLKSLIASVTNSPEDDVNDELLQGRRPAVTKRLCRYLAAAEVKLIILDEFQHLLNSKNEEVLDDVANTLKTLVIETKIPVVLVGTTKAYQVFLVNFQLARRVSDKITLKPFSISTAEDNRIFRKFLAEVDKLLPFDTPVELRTRLATEEMSTRFFAASNGYIDDIMRLIQDAGYSAIMNDSECITIEDLADAFENNPGQNNKAEGNPFTTPYELLQGWACIKDARLGKHNVSKILREANDRDVF